MTCITRHEVWGADGLLTLSVLGGNNDHGDRPGQHS